MQSNDELLIYGLGGDALMAPSHTETAFWAAIGAGGAGLVSSVKATKDKILVCSEELSLDGRMISDMTWAEIQEIDAGSDFRSTVLDSDGQPTGVYGDDRPWQKGEIKKKALQIQSLERMLTLFARRCEVILHLSFDKELIDQTVSQLGELGLLSRVRILGNLKTCEYICTIDHWSVPKVA